MTFWYPSGNLRKRIGIITDILSLGYVELLDIETEEYVMRKYSELELTK
jgi:hypothetical protein